MITSDLLTMFIVYLISLVLQLVCWPMTRTVFDKLTDKGWAVSRLITTLVISISIWELGNMGLPVNTNTGFLISLVLLASANIVWHFAYGHKTKLSKEGIKMATMEEYLFFVGLLGITFVRGFLPNIDTLEKFMDFGFINRYLNSQTLPAIDMWQAGKTINYYSFGHFWASGLIRAFLVEAAVGYNIVLGFIAGLSMSIAFSISHHLAGAKKAVVGMVAGLTGAMATVLAGNTHIIWYLIKNRSLSNYWYADATRFIQNTIHEFPGYSFVVADLHGHLLGLPTVLLLTLTYLCWLKKQEIVYEIVLGILFGVMMMTNTWDVAVYGLLFAITGVFLVLKDHNKIIGLIRAAGTMGLFMGLTAAPWMLTFESISSGIKVVTEHSPLWQLAVLWTGGLVISFLAVLIEGRGEKRLPIRAMALTVVLLIIIPELVYAKDIYPVHPRANTMFKLTYQASVMIGLLSGAVWGKLLDPHKQLPKIGRWLSTLIVSIIFLGTMIFPGESFPNYYNNFKSYHGLDGRSWIKQKMPEKYEVIKYLEMNRDGKNLVEAVGDSYTELNAVSVFASVPSIQGWRVHEWLWRGGYDSVAVKEKEVREIYETFDQELRKSLLSKYQVGWILVGADELGMYKVNDKSIKDLGKVVYEEGITYLVKVKNLEL